MSDAGEEGTLGGEEEQFFEAAARTCKVGGVEIELNEEDHAVSTVETAIYTKAARAQLDETQKLELFNQMARQKQSRRFEYISPTIDDPEVLQHTYKLQNLVNEARDHLTTYDMRQPFWIVIPSTDDNNRIHIKQVDLFAEYANVTVQQVANSNKWYRTKPKDQEPFVEDLKMSHAYLSRNTDRAVQTKVQEYYDKFSAAEHGGPLWLKLMLDEITISSTKAVEHLVTQVREIDISKLPGQDVAKAVSMIRGAHLRLRNIKNPVTKRNSVPDTFLKDIMTIINTCTVPAFVKVFDTLDSLTALMESGKEVGGFLDKDVEDILELAEKQYRVLTQAGKWLETSASGSAFTAGSTSASGAGAGTPKVCWNCGGQNHDANECPKPRNQEKIQKARAEFLKGRRGFGGRGRGGGRGGTGGRGRGLPAKWQPPTDEERRNRNRRMIDGKMHHYVYESKRWVLDRSQPLTGANVATEAATTTTTPATAPSGNVALDQKQQLAVANTARMFEQALSTLATQLKDS
jgi:hypothetical protein